MGLAAGRQCRDLGRDDRAPADGRTYLSTRFTWLPLPTGAAVNGHGWAFLRRQALQGAMSHGIKICARFSMPQGAPQPCPTVVQVVDDSARHRRVSLRRLNGAVRGTVAWLLAVLPDTQCSPVRVAHCRAIASARFVLRGQPQLACSWNVCSIPCSRLSARQEAS